MPKTTATDRAEAARYLDSVISPTAPRVAVQQLDAGADRNGNYFAWVQVLAIDTRHGAAEIVQLTAQVAQVCGLTYSPDRKCCKVWTAEAPARTIIARALHAALDRGIVAADL